MTQAIDTAQALINRSAATTEIVLAEYTPELATALAIACDDSVDAGDRLEYWGADGDEDWRVHLAL